MDETAAPAPRSNKPLIIAGALIIAYGLGYINGSDKILKQLGSSAAREAMQYLAYTDYFGKGMK